MNLNTTNPDSLDARLFPSVVLAVTPALTMDEASSLIDSPCECEHNNPDSLGLISGLGLTHCGHLASRVNPCSLYTNLKLSVPSSPGKYAFDGFIDHR